ncbi:DNA-3-methyladenine glycosylase 2 family protein [Candidatus Parvarchaeota archaeon]|nr:DNA-3-methyladenine glycosylase 2 family protein [Candidatus Parvarchaeota archaeon]
MRTEYSKLSDKKVWTTGVKYLERKDIILRKVIKKVGINDAWKAASRWWEPNHYESLVGAIVFQQISGRAGISILKKFKNLYGGKIPSPQEFLKSKEKYIRSAGISPQKYLYLKDLCERIKDGRLEPKKFGRLANEEIIRKLDEVKGIGRWTAEMYLIGTLQRTDVLPVDDLGIRKAVQKEYKLRELPNKQQLERISLSWGHYKSIASIYLWQSRD